MGSITQIRLRVLTLVVFTQMGNKHNSASNLSSHLENSNLLPCKSVGSQQGCNSFRRSI